MSLFAAWLLFPIVLSVLSLGSGRLVERASGGRIPGVLVPPLGFALIVVVTQFATNWEATAELATPVVVATALIGFAVSRSQIRVAPDGWAAAATVAIFAVFAAPVVLSGNVSFAGYTLLGDTSIHFVLIDHMVEHGRNLAGLAPSSYQAALDGYLGNGYPTGSHTPLGSAGPIVGQEVAWIFQPYLAFMAALTSLALYSLISPLIEPRGVRAAMAFLAAQPALVFAYSLQGSVKEVATVFILALIVALVPVFLRDRRRVRSVIPLAIASAAGLAILGLAIAPWLGLILAATLAALVWKRRGAARTLTIRQAAVFVLLAAALAYPQLSVSDAFLRTTTDVVTAQTEVGNLLQPLRRVQAFGIWPVGDYRVSPTGTVQTLAYLLIGIAAAAGIAGLWHALRRRALGPVLYVGALLVGGAYVRLRGSPWVDAKVLMIVSPGLVLAAMLGIGALHARGWRIQAGVVALAIASGVLWSNALAYRDVRLAPTDRLRELDRVGGMIAGQGPTIYTEFEEFAKHFLRGGDPTGSTESWQPPGSERGQFASSMDIEALSLDYVLRYRTIVLRRSPSTSRPPSVYRRTFAGRYYEVWQRPSNPRLTITKHLSLGDPVKASSTLSCTRLRRLAAGARRSRAMLAYVQRPRPLAASYAGVGRRQQVDREGQDEIRLYPTGRTNAHGTLRVRSSGRYSVWLQGSFGRGWEVRLDGRRIGSVNYELNGSGQYAYVGEIQLDGGLHNLAISLSGVSLRPGNGSGDRHVGLVVVSPRAAAARRVRYVAPERAGKLCRLELDWVEVVQS